MLNFFLEKLAVYIINKRQFYLVKVCAWCPKDEYPKLHMWQKYTHGICQKHYLTLTAHKPKQQGVRATIQDNIDKLFTLLFPKNTMAK